MTWQQYLDTPMRRLNALALGVGILTALYLVNQVGQMQTRQSRVMLQLAIQQAQDHAEIELLKDAR